jgi:hypothetical protein
VLLSVPLCFAHSLDCSAYFLRFGISLVDDRPRELLYISASRLDAIVEDAPSQQTVQLKLGRLQIDNQVCPADELIVVWGHICWLRSGVFIAM